MSYKLNFHILTLFPEMFDSVFRSSILKRAQEKGKIKINLYNLRDWATDKHKTVDDKPYGGGPGMILKVDVIDRALQDIKESQIANRKSQIRTILLTPQGKIFNQALAKKLSKKRELILICGHYEGFDERVRRLADEEISIGQYILTGGEIPAMVLLDAISRLIPGVLGKKESSEVESFSMQELTKESGIRNWRFLPRRQAGEIRNLLEYPQYTRPEEYKGMKVPKILLSGDHKKIEKWRMEQAIKRSKKLTRVKNFDN